MEETALEKLKQKYIFSIEGNIGSGKTTIIHHMQRLYQDVYLVEEPVKDWLNIEGENLLGKKNDDLSRWGYSFEAYVLITKMNELTKAASSDQKIILIERCMLTDKAFFDVNVQNGLSTPMEIAMFSNLYEFLSKNVYPKMNGIIYLDTPVEECVNRMKKRGREGEQNISTEYLKQLDDHFKLVVEESKIPTLYLNGIYDLEKDLGKIEDQLKEFVKNQIKEDSK